MQVVWHLQLGGLPLQLPQLVLGVDEPHVTLAGQRATVDIGADLTVTRNKNDKAKACSSAGGFALQGCLQACRVGLWQQASMDKFSIHRVLTTMMQNEVC